MFISKKATKENIHLHCLKSVRIRSKSGPHFPAFGLSISPYSVRMRENADQNNPEYRHFSSSAGCYQGYFKSETQILDKIMISNLWLQVNVSHLHDHKFKHLFQDLFQDKTINPLCTCKLEAKQ